MLANAAAFTAAWPEFSKVPPALVTAALAAAEAQISPGLYGPAEDRVHGLMTADMLANSPYGRESRVEGESLIYRREWEMLAVRYGIGAAPIL